MFVDNAKLMRKEYLGLWLPAFMPSQAPTSVRYMINEIQAS